MTMTMTMYYESTKYLSNYKKDKLFDTCVNREGNIFDELRNIDETSTFLGQVKEHIRGMPLMMPIW